MSKKRIIGVCITIITFLLVLLIFGVFKLFSTENQIGPRKTASNTIPARISTNPLNWYKNEKTALKKAKKISYGGKHAITFDAIAPYEKIRMLFEGKTSGETLLYETLPDIALNIEQSFPFDTTQFHHEEIVLVTTTFTKGGETSTGYFAFKALNPGGVSTSVATENKPDGFLDKALNALKPEETIALETSPSETLTAETAPSETVAAETAPSETVAVETAPSETVAVETANETTESAPTETSAQIAVTSTPVLFNGFELKSFVNEQEALNNASRVSTKVASNSTLQAIVDEKVSRVRIYIENENGGNLSHEEILYADNNWSANLSLEKYSGQTIIIGLSASDNSFVPKMTTSYSAFKIE